MGLSDDLQEECHSVILHDNMTISRLMVHAQQMEDTRAKRKCSDTKTARSFDSGSSKSRLEIQDKPRFKKRVSVKFLKSHDDMLSNCKLKKGKGTSSQPRIQLV